MVDVNGVVPRLARDAVGKVVEVLVRAWAS